MRPLALHRGLLEKGDLEAERSSLVPGVTAALPVPLCWPGGQVEVGSPCFWLGGMSGKAEGSRSWVLRGDAVACPFSLSGRRGRASEGD